ncbi:MAG: hypothetical protein KBT48_08260 [Firmicutes bacterium]|nr:hypothetical protein [Bacillota bacterium]
MQKEVNKITVNKEMILSKIKKEMLMHKTVVAWVFQQYIDDFQDYSIERLEKFFKKNLKMPDTWEELYEKTGIMPDYFEMHIFKEEEEKIYFYLVNTHEDKRFRETQYSLQMYANPQDEKKSKKLECLVINVNHEQKNNTICVKLAIGGPKKEIDMGFNMMQVTEAFTSDDIPLQVDRLKSPLSILLAKNMNSKKKKKEIRNRFGLEIPDDLGELLEMYSQVETFLTDETITLSIREYNDSDPQQNMN